MSDWNRETNSESAGGASATLRALRQHKPLVQNITNFVLVEPSVLIFMGVSLGTSRAGFLRAARDNCARYSGGANAGVHG